MITGISVLLVLVAFGDECLAKNTSCPDNCMCDDIVFYYKVNCSNAALYVIPKNLEGNITSLSLSGNRLKCLKNNTFEKYSKIMQLYLDHNRISIFQVASLWNLHELRYLFLDHNSLTHIPQEAFINNKVLEKLDLSGNKLFIPESGGLFRSSSVTQLILAECNFNYLPADMFDRMLVLERLDLRNNTIESLSLETFEALKNFNNLSLEGNKLKCNCDIVPFYNWAVKRNVTVKADCSSGSTIWNKVSSALCENASQTLWIGVGAGVGVLLLLVLVAVLTCYVRGRRKQTPMAQMRRQPLPSLPPGPGSGPTGEYIEVLGEKTYESVKETELTRYTTAPMTPRESVVDGPVYVNAFVPPKPRREHVTSYDDVGPPSLKVDAPARCLSLASIIKDCDYYETVN